MAGSVEEGTVDANRDLVERYWKAASAQDLDAVYDMRHEDYTETYPQSGERIVGRENARAVDTNYPGMPQMTSRRILGSGDVWVVEADLTYGDGNTYKVADILEIRDGKISAETAYWGAPFEPAEWRSQWVERTEG